MIIKVSGLIIIRRQVGKGMRGTAACASLAPSKNGLWKAGGEWKANKAGRKARGRIGGSGFALSQGQSNSAGWVCRVTVTLQHCGNQRHEAGLSQIHRDQCSLLPAPPPWGHKPWGAQGTTRYFTYPRLNHPHRL